MGLASKLAQKESFVSRVVSKLKIARAIAPQLYSSKRKSCRLANKAIALAIQLICDKPLQVNSPYIRFLQTIEQYQGSPQQSLAIAFLLNNIPPDVMQDFFLLWAGKAQVKVTNIQSQLSNI